MDYIKLGGTDILVSRLCFGSLTVSPLQRNLNPREAGEIIAYGLNMGINFIDTAQLYNNYEHIAHALKLYKKDVVIASKTYAYTRELARNSVEEARGKLNRDVIDIFMLHEQESAMTLQGHSAAIEYLLECKQKGIIRAVGVSTHHIACVRAAVEIAEIEIIHPMFNYAGVGIVDGNIEQMRDTIKSAFMAGKGIYAMKVLGGGTLIQYREKALKYALEYPYIHSIALGMQSRTEIEANILKFENKQLPKDLELALNKQVRHLHIENWCKGCGTCVPICKQGALNIIGNTLKIDKTKCVLCGYCARGCSDFALKII